MPAGLCGVYGLKPTYGTVDMRGVWPLAPSLDTGGPLATSAEDTFLMLEAMSDFRRGEAAKPRVLIAKNYFFDEAHPGVVKLVVDQRPARTCVHPWKRTPIKVPWRMSLKARLVRRLKEKVMGRPGRG